MANRYRVIDLRTGVIETEIVVDNARSPEHAAREALGMEVVRSGSKKELVARVYWQVPPQPQNMVRLYAKADGRSN